MFLIFLSLSSASIRIKDWNNFLRFRGIGVSHAIPLFFSNGMITHHWKRGVGVSYVTPLFAYTLTKKRNNNNNIYKRKIENKMNKMDCISIIVHWNWDSEKRKRGKKGIKYVVRVCLGNKNDRCSRKLPLSELLK